MNEFERKLSEQRFQAPPPDLRDTLFTRSEVLADVAVSTRWAWGDWFWPSPQAWAALAALWMVFALLSLANRPAGAAPASAANPQPSATALLAYQHGDHSNHVLEFAN